MRNVLLGLGIALMIVGTATAAPSLSILGPGGVSSYAPAAGETFQITIVVHNDIVPNNEAGTGPGGLGEGLGGWQVTGFAGPAGFKMAAVSGNAAYDNTAIFPTTGTLSWSTNAPMPISLAMYSNADILAYPAVGDYQVFHCKVIAPNPLTLGVITQNVEALWIDQDGGTHPAQLTGLTITPEPISALLLLAGLPLLRRRR